MAILVGSADRAIAETTPPTYRNPTAGAADINDTTAYTSRRLNDGCHIVTAQLPNGRQMALEVPTRDDIGDRIAATSRPYEAVDLRIVDAFLPRNPAIIDVGANIGNHAIYWALTSRADVTAFEPYAPARRLLDANIARNAVGQLVIPQGEALGNVAGRAAPEPRMGNLGATQIQTDPDGPVDIIALDTIQPARCDLLKVDVEGGEVAALEGASDLLTRLRPLVWVEVLTASDRTAVRDLMRSHGYFTCLMLSPTNALYLPRHRCVLRLGTHPRAFLAYSRRTIGRLVRNWRRRRGATDQ